MPFMSIRAEMHKFKAGKLHSGSPTGKIVTNPKQALAISLSEQRKAEPGSVKALRKAAK